MNELDRAATAVVERPAGTANSLPEIEHRASRLARRRRAAWIGAVGVVLVLILVSISAISAQHDDETIVVGPPVSAEQTLEVPMVKNGGPDQVAEIAAAMQRRLEQSDFVDVAVSATDASVVLAGSGADLDAIKRTPWLFASTADVRSIETRSESAQGACAIESGPGAGSAYPGPDGLCYGIGHGSGANLTIVTSASGTSVTGTPALTMTWTDPALRSWAAAFAQQCVALSAACPTGGAALFTDQGIAFVAASYLVSEADSQLALRGAPDLRTAKKAAAVLNNPLPPKVIFPDLAASVTDVLVAAFDIGAGTDGTEAGANGWIHQESIPQTFKPSTAIVDPSQIAGKRAAINIPRNSVIVEGMFE